MGKKSSTERELPMVSLRIKALRKTTGVTQVQLAGVLSVSKGTVAMWESGARMPKAADVYKMARLFRCRMDYILGYSIDDRLYDYDLEFLL